MSQGHTFFSATLAELTRRKVPRTVGAYAVAVFVLLQLMDAAVEPLRLPDWLPTLMVIVLILGFPLVFLLAWQFEITQTGVKRTDAAGLLSRSQTAVLFSAMMLATVGLGYVFYAYYSSVFESTPGAAEVAQQLPTEEPRQFTAPQNSIAVLPFADLSAEGNQAYFSDGVAEEILNILAQVNGLHVAARTSSFAFRDPQHDIREIGRLLNVRTVLEGSIRSSGNRIRLTAQLINVEDGFHIWSQSYDREMDDLFAIQDEVASQIAKALVESFAGLEQNRSGTTDSLAAANAYRTGRLHWWRRTPGELERALGLFAEALKHDAGFAPAYAAMADSWLLLSQYGNISTQKATERAQPMIDQALALDPSSAEAFAALGLARWQIGQRDAAESALRRAVELNEDYIPAQLWLAGVLGEQGRLPEEHRVLEQALILDPLNELLAVNLANNLRTRGINDEARQVLSGQLELRPGSTTLLRALAGLELATGNLAEGLRLAQRSLALEPDNPMDITLLADAWLMLDRMDTAEQLLQAGLQQSAENSGLLGEYWFSLFRQGRYEEARRLTLEMLAEDEQNLPLDLRRGLYLRLGILAIMKQDNHAALDALRKAAEDSEALAWKEDVMLAITFAAEAARRLGQKDTARQFLQTAARNVQRARLNGVNDAGIAYTEAALFAMDGEVSPALQKLQQAYELGFRQRWLMELDWRMDSLRDTDEFTSLQSRIAEDIRQAAADVSTNRVAAG